MNRTKLLLSVMIVSVIVLVYFYFRYPRTQKGVNRTAMVLAWLQNPQVYPDWRVSAGTRCQGAVFELPTDGFIGYLWGDSFYPGHHHQGVDIFGGTEVGVTPVYAAYDGYLTRLPDWKATVIIRVPEDPLQPGRQIWLYYTHMADQNGNSFISSQFPPGSYEIFVSAGTLLGYQGNFSGTPDNPTGVHLHFSIVKDDGNGSFLNELKIENTIDPSPYFGLPLNAKTNHSTVPLCP